MADRDGGKKKKKKKKAPKPGSRAAQRAAAEAQRAAAAARAAAAIPDSGGAAAVTDRREEQFLLTFFRRRCDGRALVGERTAVAALALAWRHLGEPPEVRDLRGMQMQEDDEPARGEAGAAFAAATALCTRRVAIGVEKELQQMGCEVTVALFRDAEGRALLGGRKPWQAACRAAAAAGPRDRVSRMQQHLRRPAVELLDADNEPMERDTEAPRGTPGSQFGTVTFVGGTRGTATIAADILCRAAPTCVREQARSGGRSATLVRADEQEDTDG